MNKLSTNNFLILFTAMIISILAIIVLWLNDIYTQSNDELIYLKQNYIKSQKDLLKTEVNRVVEDIEYRRDIEEKRLKKIDIKILQKEIINRIRQIRFGTDGYIFICTNEGVNILHPIKPELEGKNVINLKDPNGKFIIKELIKASKNRTNSFVKYIWYQPSSNKFVNKLGYAQYIDEWNWMVGSGIYMNSIDKVIQQKEVELDKRIQKRVVQVLILFFLILLIILYFLYKQSAKINNSFKLFHNILQQAHKKISIINLDKIDFIEFKELAIDFNNMVNIVQNNINNLDKIVKDKTANLSKINRELKESKREVVLINENLTEQKTAFKDLFQKTSDGITIIKDGKFVDCNDAIMKMLKYKTKDQLLNVHPSELSPEFQPDGEDSFTKANRMMQIAIDTGSNTFEWVHLRANGEEFWAEIVLTQMIQNRETIIHVVWRDISKRKQIEFELEQLTSDLELRIKEEVQKNREKDKAMLQQSKLAQMGELLSMIAHQWRQPLTAISATSNDLSMKIMLDNYSEDYFSEKLKKIVELSQHLSNTIDDFRTFNKEDKEKTAVLFSTLVKSVLGIVSISIENNNIDLTTDFKCEKKMLTYSNEVKQVILNLIKNAEDILLEKNIQKAYIHLKTYDDENYTYLKISDNAGGVPEDIIDKIFNPYFSTKTKKDGTGLGLYMSKIIIEEHCGGELSVYNDENGAVFEIKLPLKGY